MSMRRSERPTAGGGRYRFAAADAAAPWCGLPVAGKRRRPRRCGASCAARCCWVPAIRRGFLRHRRRLGGDGADLRCSDRAGVVGPEGSRQRVQHLEGGIIQEIRVREGDRVAAGDVLVALAGVGAQAEAGQLTGRLRALAATEARLQAERTGAPAISFRPPVACRYRTIPR